jgi:hypothetical protein
MKKENHKRQHRRTPPDTISTFLRLQVLGESIMGRIVG